MRPGMRGRRFLQHLALDGPHRYLDASTMFRAEDLRRLVKSDAYAHLAQHDPFAQSHETLRNGGHWLSAIQYRDLHTYLPLDILTKVDRMTMAHSLEARPPLLDHRIVEFAATIPAHYRLRGGTTKYLFKQALRGLLPDDLGHARGHRSRRRRLGRPGEARCRRRAAQRRGPAALRRDRPHLRGMECLKEGRPVRLGGGAPFTATTRSTGAPNSRVVTPTPRLREELR